VLACARGSMRATTCRTCREASLAITGRPMQLERNEDETGGALVRCDCGFSHSAGPRPMASARCLGEGKKGHCRQLQT
jgi:hypothetical protein